VLGGGYTRWNKQQQLEGIVQLNDLDVATIKADTNDDNSPQEGGWDDDDTGMCGIKPTSCDPKDVPDQQGSTPRYEKDIATCFADIDEASTGEKMDFHILDGYPSYFCAVRFVDHNVGSVPVKLQRIMLQGQVICPSRWYDVDADQDGEADANVHIKEPVLGQQLDPSDELFGQVDVHIKQGAPQGKAFSFLIELIWTQSNMFDPTATGCDAIIDADGIATVGDGLGTHGTPVTPGALDVSPGDPLTTWPAVGTPPEGLDMFDNDMDGAWTFSAGGDDLHLEDPAGACSTAIRDGVHHLGLDCKVLDYDGSLFEGQFVTCDMESLMPDPVGGAPGSVCPTNLAFYDANGDGGYNNGEDIVLDADGDTVFD